MGEYVVFVHGPSYVVVNIIATYPVDSLEFRVYIYALWLPGFAAAI